jgi:hypothetical protein
MIEKLKSEHAHQTGNAEQVSRHQMEVRVAEMERAYAEKVKVSGWSKVVCVRVCVCVHVCGGFALYGVWQCFGVDIFV